MSPGVRVGGLVLTYTHANRGVLADLQGGYRVVSELRRLVDVGYADGHIDGAVHHSVRGNCSRPGLSADRY